MCTSERMFEQTYNRAAASASVRRGQAEYSALVAAPVAATTSTLVAAAAPAAAVPTPDALAQASAAAPAWPPPPAPAAPRGSSCCARAAPASSQPPPQQQQSCTPASAPPLPLPLFSLRTVTGLLTSEVPSAAAAAAVYDSAAASASVPQPQPQPALVASPPSLHAPALPLPLPTLAARVAAAMPHAHAAAPAAAARYDSAASAAASVPPHRQAQQSPPSQLHAPLQTLALPLFAARAGSAMQRGGSGRQPAAAAYDSVAAGDALALGPPEDDSYGATPPRAARPPAPRFTAPADDLVAVWAMMYPRTTRPAGAFAASASLVALPAACCLSLARCTRRLTRCCCAPCHQGSPPPPAPRHAAGAGRLRASRRHRSAPPRVPGWRQPRLFAPPWSTCGGDAPPEATWRTGASG